MAVTASSSLLIVDDDLHFLRSAERAFTRLGWQVTPVKNATDALSAAGQRSFDAVLVDFQLPDGDGVTLIERLQDQSESPIASIVLSGHVDVPSTVRAMRAGAFEVIQKPVSAVEVDLLLRAAASSRSARVGPRPSQPPKSGSILGETPAMRAVHEQIRTVAPYRDLSVLLVGEPGTGKELVAKAIHAQSGTDGPFLPLDCGAIPETLFESELFGQDAGSNTDSWGTRAGLLELAGSGSIFLDELRELPTSLAPKLFRALETRAFRRVGGHYDIPFRARVISATNPNVSGRDAVLQSDLYYHLSGFTILMPRLRDRTADIELLATQFLNASSATYAGPPRSFSPRALEALRAYHFPGNVRELKGLVEEAAALTGGPLVGVAEVSAVLNDHNAFADSSPSVENGSATSAVPPAKARPLRELERQLIEEAWEASGKNLSAAARQLGLPRTTMRDRLTRYGLR